MTSCAGCGAPLTGGRDTFGHLDEWTLCALCWHSLQDEWRPTGRTREMHFEMLCYSGLHPLAARREADRTFGQLALWRPLFRRTRKGKFCMWEVPA